MLLGCWLDELHDGCLLVVLAVKKVLERLDDGLDVV